MNESENKTQTERVVFKILTDEEWTRLQSTGLFQGSTVDLKDGFIHFSTGSQAAETANRHFAGKAGLQLVGVEVAALGDDLRWEPSRGGDLFPHLYADLKFESVVSSSPLEPDEQGVFHIDPEN